MTPADHAARRLQVGRDPAVALWSVEFIDAPSHGPTAYFTDPGSARAYAGERPALILPVAATFETVVADEQAAQLCAAERDLDRLEGELADLRERLEEIKQKKEDT